MPSWIPTMFAACIAASIVGYIAAWAIDEYIILRRRK